MAESSIDFRVVFSDTSARDRFQVMLRNLEADTVVGASQLESLGLDPPLVLPRESSFSIMGVTAMGAAALEFKVRGSIASAPAFVAQLVSRLKKEAREIIYADLNEQVMEIAVYYHSDKAECSYETGFYGDADEALWEADRDGTLLDTVRELALSNHLKMPVS